jgi:RNA polymerase subunit RPABC4/transcription elongation factor Spt4
MPEFKDKEEYEKWKAEKLKSNIETLKEDERLSKLWICPECLNSNDNTQTKCQCGYTAAERLLNYFRFNITANNLFRMIVGDKKLGDDEKVLLSHYLAKRFPGAEESKAIKNTMYYHLNKPICAKCGGMIKSGSTFCPECKADFSGLLSSGLIIVGLILLVFSLTMDTTVSTTYGDHVHNIGLLNKKTNFTIISSVMILTGVVLLISNKMRHNESSSKKTIEENGIKKCHYCDEIIKAEAIICRYCGKEQQLEI